MELQQAPLKITKREIRSLVNDAAKSAEAIDLVYVSDKQPGIKRVRKGGKFIYTIDNRSIKAKEEISRIKSLVIPPAWEQVWICPFPNGHVQATGIDTKGRKQYRYHSLWNALRKETKFFHMYDFGKALPLMRKQIKEDISLKGFPQQKVLAVIVSLMENTGIRVGNNCYEKTYGTYGITTLKNQHVNINGDEIKFKFIGKKGVSQDLKLKSKKLAKIVQQCKCIPGKELFQYYDENGAKASIDSGMVNSYIKGICGKHFTAKDFRTWFGTTCALEVFLHLDHCDDVNETNKKVIETLDIVAKRLGNTRLVCRKYYVHPMVIDHYSNNSIERYVEKATKIDEDKELSPVEKTLMVMLENTGHVTISR